MLQRCPSRIRLVLWGVAAGCVYEDPKEPPPPEPEPETVEAPTWQIERVDDDACGANDVPAPRSGAGVAFFVAPEPVQVQGVWLDRGVAVVGGEGAGGVLLSDAWLLDVGAPPESCPWLRLSTDVLGGGGWAWGSLQALDDDLLLIGGRQSAGGQVASVSALRRVSVGALASGQPFAYEADLAADEVTSVEFDDPFCLAPTHLCIESDCSTATELAYDPCTGEVLGADCYGDSNVDGPNFGMLDPPCTYGPSCLPGREGVLGDDLAFTRTSTVPATAEMAVFPAAGGWFSLYGGTAGCTGASCAVVEWLDMGRRLPDGADAAWNVARGWTIDGADWSGAREEAPVTLTAWLGGSALEGWPSGASRPGLRSAGGATGGLDWDPATRRWVASPGAPAGELLVGGTSHQEVYPERWFIVTPAAALTCPSFELPGYFGDYETVAVEPDFGPDLPLAWRASGDPAFDALDPVPGVTGRPLPVRTFPAVTHFDVGAVLVVGGVEASGAASTAVDLVDLTFDPFLVREVGDLALPVAGAGAVLDPVSRRAWVVGGTTLESAAWSVHHAQTVRDPARNGAFDVEALEIEVAREDAPTLEGPWDVTYGWRLVLDCRVPASSPEWSVEVGPGTERCARDRITLELLEAAVDVTTLEVRRGPDGDWFPLLPVGELEVSAGGTPSREYRLPMTLRHDDVLDLRATVRVQTTTLTAVVDGPAGMYRVLLGGEDSCTDANDPPELAWLKGILVRPLDADQVPLARTRFLPGGAGVFTGVGPGVSEACGTAPFEVLAPISDTPGDTCFDAGGADGPMQVGATTLRLSLANHLVPVGLIDGRVEGWVQDCLVAPLFAEIGDWFSGTAGVADLWWLEDLLGPLPGERWSVLLTLNAIGAGKGSVGGLNRDGAVWSGTFSAEGTEVGAAAGQNDRIVFWESAVVHELAHSWFGYQRTWRDPVDETEPSVQWWIEGMPTLLSTMRYPASGGNLALELLDHRRRFARAVDGLVLSRLGDPAWVSDPYAEDRARADPAHNLEITGQPRAHYMLAPYVWSQLLHQVAASRAEVADPLAALRRWQAHLGGDPLQELTPDDLEAIVEAEAPGFWADWVDQDTSLGVPLLGVESVIVDPSGATTVVLRQWQADLFGWPLFGDVPFYLGCQGTLPGDPPPWTDCDLDQAGFLPGRGKPRSWGPASSTLSVVLAPGAGAPVPARFALSAGPSLLPGIPTYDAGAGAVRDGLEYASAPKWKLLCAGSTAGACAGAPDIDADGWPDEEDCEVHPDLRLLRNGEVHFLAPEQPLAPGDDPTIDANCDGWPSPAMVKKNLEIQ